MKILLITEFFPTGKDLRFSGGVEARTYFVGEHLAKQHDVFVVCSHQPGSLRREKINGINVRRVGQSMPYNAGSGKMNPIKLASFIVEAIKEGKRIRPDIIDGGNFLAHTIAKQISTISKIPVVFWYPDVFFGLWIKTSGIISGIGGYVNEKLNLIRSADKFIAISKITRKKLLNNGVIESKITVIPCGVDKKEFTRKVKKSALPQIICVSRLVSYKRVEDLIWAFAAIRNKGIRAELAIVGEGPEQGNLDNLVEMLKIRKHVKFLKNLKRKRLIDLIKSSHIFCSPSEIEGFGISTIEAAAAGLPYVISDIDVFKEITKNGKGGLLFRLADIRDLARKLESLLTDKRLYRFKSKEAINLSKFYDWEKVAKETEKIYKSLI